MVLDLDPVLSILSFPLMNSIFDACILQNWQRVHILPLLDNAKRITF